MKEHIIIIIYIDSFLGIGLFGYSELVFLFIYMLFMCCE